MVVPLTLRTVTRSVIPHRFSSLFNKRVAQLAGAGVVCYAGQKQFGSAENFFDHRYITTKKPEDLADMYGSEDFMEIFCVFPFMVQLMMRSGEFDDDGTFHAIGLSSMASGGGMEVSIEFNEREIDTDGDGEPDTIAWFNKRETFKDSGLWQMTQNFGYNRRDDGTCEVYHNGESFNGLFPIRFLFQLHAKYVFWATQRYIESKEFGSFDREEEAEEVRQNIPMYAFKEFISGLTTQVELAREKNKDNIELTAKHDKTLAALRKLSNREDVRDGLAHFKTVRRHGTYHTHVHLVMEDAESAEAVRSAMNQISHQGGGGGGSGPQRHATTGAKPVSAIGKLQHRVTMMPNKDAK